MDDCPICHFLREGQLPIESSCIASVRLVVEFEPIADAVSSPAPPRLPFCPRSACRSHNRVLNDVYSTTSGDSSHLHLAEISVLAIRREVNPSSRAVGSIGLRRSIGDCDIRLRRLSQGFPG